MPWPARATGRVSRSNCGLWRERGTVRTSMSRATECSFSNAMNSASARVEWPTVNTTGSESGVVIVRANSGSALSQRVDSPAQHRYKLPLKPGVVLEPWLIERRGVGQRYVLGSVLTPGAHSIGQRQF